MTDRTRSRKRSCRSDTRRSRVRKDPASPHLARPAGPAAGAGPTCSPDWSGRDEVAAPFPLPQFCRAHADCGFIYARKNENTKARKKATLVRCRAASARRYVGASLAPTLHVHHGTQDGSRASRSSRRGVPLEAPEHRGTRRCPPPPVTARTLFVQAQKHEFFLVASFRAFRLK
jgi:hypothetical protein